MTFSLERTLGSLVGCTAVLLMGFGPSFAQKLPAWDPNDICAKDSARGQCLLLEHRARNDVATSWDVLPDSARNSCLTRFAPPLEPSWRILGDCIEFEGRRAQQVRAEAQSKREDATLAGLGRKSPTGDGATVRIAQADGERERIEREEASFLATLAAQRAADAEAAKRDAAAKKAAETKKAATVVAQSPPAETQNKATDEAEKRRLEAEEASFLATLAQQRKADEEAKQKAVAAAELAKERAAEAERKRLADEEATFLATLETQRKADAEAKKKADEAAKQAAAEVQKKAAQSCEAKLAEVNAAGVIQFASNSAELSDSAGSETLDRLAAVAATCEGELMIVVEGHTDSTGSASGNVQLSQSRAETVAKYLSDKGVPQTRISSRGFGAAKPIAPNNTPEGRAKNRRIEFKVKAAG